MSGKFLTDDWDYARMEAQLLDDLMEELRKRQEKRKREAQTVTWEKISKMMDIFYYDRRGRGFAGEYWVDF